MATNMLTMILSNCGDIFFFDMFYRIFCQFNMQMLAKLIDNTENFCNFG